MSLVHLSTMRLRLVGLHRMVSREVWQSWHFIIAFVSQRVTPTPGKKDLDPVGVCGDL